MSLANKIWLTRKCRIKCSERLKRNNYISQSLITWYSFLLIAFTIYQDSLSSHYDSIILILSIALLVISVYVMAMNYSARSIKMQILYTQLDNLYKQVEKEQDQVNLDKFYKQYTDLIALTENHSEYDYLKVRLELNKVDKAKYPEPKELECSDWVLLALKWFFYSVVPLLLFPLPLVLWYVFAQ